MEFKSLHPAIHFSVVPGVSIQNEIPFIIHSPWGHDLRVTWSNLEEIIGSTSSINILSHEVS